MPTLRLFASAREAAGTARAEIEAATVAEMLDKARGQFGERFGRVLDTSPGVGERPAGGDGHGHHRPRHRGRPAARLRRVEPGRGGRPGRTAPPARPRPGPAAVPAPGRRPPGPPRPGGRRGPPVAARRPPRTPPRLRRHRPRPVPACVPWVAPASTVRTPPAGPATGRSGPPAASGWCRPRRPTTRPTPPPPTTHPPRARPRPSSVGGSMGRLALAPAARAVPAAAGGPARPRRPSGSRRRPPPPRPPPEPAPVPEAKPAAPLAVVHQSTRPHGRLGVAWAVVTAGVLCRRPRVALGVAGGHRLRGRVPDGHRLAQAGRAARCPPSPPPPPPPCPSPPPPASTT